MKSTDPFLSTLQDYLVYAFFFFLAMITLAVAGTLVVLGFHWLRWLDGVLS